MRAVLLAVDANEGIKPQTVEHLEIARLIGVRRGVLALTQGGSRVAGDDRRPLRRDRRRGLRGPGWRSGR